MKNWLNVLTSAKDFASTQTKDANYCTQQKNCACDLKECPKRHPRTCKYGYKWTYFINGICFYEHDKQNVSKTTTNKPSKLSKKLDAIFDMIKQKEVEMNAIKEEY